MLSPKPNQIRAGKTEKPTQKIKESGKNTRLSNPKKTKPLITLLTALLSDDWEEEEKISALFIFINQDKSHIPNTGLEPLHLLTISIHKEISQI